MSVALVTGSAGLIGSEAVRHFAGLGLDVVGIDNDMRAQFFGPEASTAWNVLRLTTELGDAYTHHDVDIRDRDALAGIFAKYGRDIAVVIHTAAQPSHDWAVRDPFTDFDVNAGGTLNILQNVRDHCIEAPVIHCSTNKVYGDRPNSLPLIEQETRWEIDPNHTYADGIREDMSIDACLHSVFGASKVAADVMVQEYGRYFDMKTACFRGGTLTGPAHSATELHGFLGYVMRANMERRTYNLFGYKGKQVRDAIHSHDVTVGVRGVLPQPAQRRGLQPRRRPALQRAPTLRRSRSPRRSPARRWSTNTRRPTGSATTSGGSARTPRSRPTIRSGSRSTTCR